MIGNKRRSIRRQIFAFIWRILMISRPKLQETGRLTQIASRAACYLLIGACMLCLPAKSQSVPPSIFFTDITSGPNTGGENVNGYSGAYVTIYGNNFGSSQGSSAVTLNGQTCLRVVSWGGSYLWYQKLVVQLGANCTSGGLAVRTQAGTSNAVSFAVRSGNIYCISTGGNDSNNGKFPSSCWATMANAALRMTAGDTVYLLNGVKNVSTTQFSAVVNIMGNPGGSASMPIAFVAYPGATATIGDLNNSTYAIRVPQVGDNPAYYVIAGLTIRGNEAMDVFSADHWSIIGNDMSCTTNGWSCFHANGSTNLYLYGNNVHDIHGAAKLYHAVYFTTDTNHVWLGWNLVDPDPSHTGAAGCRGVQFYSTGGSDQYDLHVHDNIIRDTVCDALNFATINPDQGTVEAYNNVIYHAGTGPDPDGLADYSCIYADSASSPRTPVALYNNSLYDCGARGFSGLSGAFKTGIPIQLRNNIAYMTNGGEAYINGSCSNLSGGNNIWFGNGSDPCSSNLSKDMGVNPAYKSATDLHLTSGSSAIDKGQAIGGLTRDITGVPRPQGGGYDVGAYEYSNGTATGKQPTCDLNADGVVNSLDVTIAINQALGIGGYNNLSLTQDGGWSVVDVQRVINAADGQACRIGP